MKSFGKIGVTGGFIALSMICSGCVKTDSNINNYDDYTNRTPADVMYSQTLDDDQSLYSPPSFKMQKGRKQSCSATLELNVAGKTEDAIKETITLAEKYSGNMIEYSMNKVTVKVPWNNSNDFMTAVEKLGNVFNRNIIAKDVTDEYTDVELRCKNLRSLRDRYAALLAKAGKVEDILKIEKELSRVTSELERYQGRFKVLKNSVEMVKFDITFNTVYNNNNEPVPVKWIRSIGDNITREENVSVENNFALDIDMPLGFVTISSCDWRKLAVNSANSVLQMRSFKDLPGATAEFYQNFIRKQLSQKGYTNIEVQKAVFHDDISGFSITAVCAENSYTVLIALYKDGLICKQDKVLVLELQGKSEDIKQIDIKKLIGSLKFN